MSAVYRVSTKAAIFSQNKDKALVIHMDKIGRWGLPGGHVERGETPDEAIVRELREECGVTPSNLERVDFFMHSEGKLILAYAGTANETELRSPQNDLEGVPKWLTKNEFEQIKIEPNYKALVVKEWAS